MKKYKTLTFGLNALLQFYGCAQQETEIVSTQKDSTMVQKVVKTDEEWQKELTPNQYYVLRQKGTERPGTGEYNLHFENGVYNCAGCNSPLFKSDSKFESHCGWPSFDAAISDSTIIEIEDRSHGMIRTEIVCAKCNGHLGHVFNDGPTETGTRFCVNSASLNFLEK
jgi:peptide-methionine (R)-S-oxide reductase